MTYTLIEKILANHSDSKEVSPGKIINVAVDVRAARDFGGANVIKNLTDNNLGINDSSKTFFTFDCNPTGSDQKYAVNQQKCRVFARNNNIEIFDINNGIGTHTIIDRGIATPGSTVVTTDSHANILGAIGAFGQGMGDKDIAAAFSTGEVWFKVPHSVRIKLKGKRPPNLTAKDIVLNLLKEFGANSLLGCSVEMCGDEVENFTLDERITISSMATEMGCIIIFFEPGEEILEYLSKRAGRKLDAVRADKDANYLKEYVLDLSGFVPMVALPGKPHDNESLKKVQAERVKIDSAFIGSCTNGRMEDMRAAASILKNKKVAPGVLLKIVPSTDEIWQKSLDEGLIAIFKKAGAMVSNAGCAGCAAGQVGQNGEGEITVSTGNRNFPGKQGKGKVYLASPSTVAASSVAGYICSEENIPDKPKLFVPELSKQENKEIPQEKMKMTETQVQGRVWYIPRDNIDTDMIYHNRYLAVTDIEEMGQYTFDNLEGYEDFASRAEPGDIVVVHKNFGSGSSRQQAVDCFKSLGIQAIVAESYGAIYERNAVNAAMPIVICKDVKQLQLQDGNIIHIDFVTGEIKNKDKMIKVQAEPFSDVQLEIMKRGGLL